MNFGSESELIKRLLCCISDFKNIKQTCHTAVVFESYINVPFHRVSAGRPVEGCSES